MFTIVAAMAGEAEPSLAGGMSCDGPVMERASEVEAAPPLPAAAASAAAAPGVCSSVVRGRRAASPPSYPSPGRAERVALKLSVADAVPSALVGEAVAAAAWRI